MTEYSFMDTSMAPHDVRRYVVTVQVEGTVETTECGYDELILATFATLSSVNRWWRKYKALSNTLFHYQVWDAEEETYASLGAK